MKDAFILHPPPFICRLCCSATKESSTPETAPARSFRRGRCSAPCPVPEIRPMLRLRPTLATFLLCLALTPAIADAQGTGRTHTVKRGDTLWDLAQQYLGDPFKWPEIYRRNSATVQDPNLIYPDQTIVIDGEVVADAGTPADVPGDTTSTGQPMPQQPAGEPPAMTIFNPERYRVVRGQRTSLRVGAPASVVRSGDYLQAPFLWDANGVAGAGRLDATMQSDGIGLTLTERPVQMFENIYVQVPAGVTGVKDERLMVFRYGPMIEGRGRVVVPTGIVKLTADAVSGRATAVLMAKYEDVFGTHLLMALDTLVMKPGVFPTAVEFGVKTTLAYLYGNPVLPPVGHQIIFAAGSGQGIVTGDQVTLQVEMGNDERGQPLPPQDVATARVTRVTQWGASAIIIRQTDGGLREGMTAVVTGKMP